MGDLVRYIDECYQVVMGKTKPPNPSIEILHKEFQALTESLELIIKEVVTQTTKNEVLKVCQNPSPC